MAEVSHLRVKGISVESTAFRFQNEALINKRKTVSQCHCKMTEKKTMKLF